jgi:hypothetical protein
LEDSANSIGPSFIKIEAPASAAKKKQHETMGFGVGIMEGVLVNHQTRNASRIVPTLCVET